MRSWGFFCLLVVSSASLLAQTTPDVGSGSPTDAVKQAFLVAWGRRGFNTLVGDPSGNVAKYGSTGLIQQFPSVTTGGGTLALVKPDATGNFNVAQVLAGMFAFYDGIGPATAGYPTTDTGDCPALLAASNSGNSCQWQLFSTKYALFVYASPPVQGGPANVATRDPFYTKWNTFGGITGLGPADSAETAITSQYGSQATGQMFDQGAIYNLTSGAYSGRLFAVKEPVYDLYVSNGAHAGSLGLPTTEELVLSNGRIRQSFEGGSIDYDPFTKVPVLRPPVSRVTLAPSGTAHLNTGDTLAAQVTVYGADGAILTDRTLAWNSSNGRVVQVQPNGLTATLKAVGAGTANITVTVEGKTSLALVVSVTSPCCQIGEGAPTASIQRAFQDAVSRNRLSVQVPAASPATRAGNGYAQQLLSTATPSVSYLVAVPDGTATGYVVTGAILAEYTARGGPAGTLGYPLSDATPGGRQAFQQATLAGNPVQSVSGAVLAKWGALGYETGAAGLPIAPAAPFVTFRGTAGSMQAFQNAVILSSGPLAYLVSGLVLAKYTASGGPTGDLGAPTGDERSVNGLRQQDFEGGSINFATGASEAAVVIKPRQPLVTATPASVLAGTSVHLAIGGFNSGAAVRVSQTGQPDFVVTLANGSYAWDVRVPAAAANSAITVSAAELNGAASAQASYSIRSASSASLAVSVASGDRQNGAPGAQLAEPLAVVVQDSSGNAVVGQTVTFAASAGAQISPASAVTDSSGRASAVLRLPLAAGVVLATAQTGGKIVTFSARAAAYSLPNFPVLTQDVDGKLGGGSDTIRQKGALLAAAASILRYYQLRNEMPQPNGPADVATLNQFLKSLCLADSQSNQICDGFLSRGAGSEQIVNLWRLGAFAANDVDVRIEQPDLNTVRDLASAGSPVLLALSLGAGLGSHFVVATGVNGDGSLTLADPNPALAPAAGGYFNGFATLTGAARLLPQAPSTTAFLVAVSAPVVVSSASGACGQTLQFPDTAAVAATTPANPPGMLYFRSCDGSAGPYQLDITSQGAFAGTFTDLSTGGGRSVLSGSASQVVRSGQHWTLAPLTVSIDPARILNAASFTGDLAPGGLISIFGTGLSGATVQIDETPAAVLASFPFQVNAQIPFDAAPGAATLSVNSANGSATQPISISGVAPAIFSVAPSQAAITNQDNSLNTGLNPALRGSYLFIYGTGFGAVTRSGAFSRANTPVSAVIGGTEIPAAFAGLTPGAIGLYQANVQIPANLPPGLSLPLFLKQGSATSNIVTVAIQ